MACIWIALGTAGEDGWITELKSVAGGDEQFQSYEPYQIYVLSIYWVFTVLTTVGYGDYAGLNSQEFLFTIFLEFCGLTFFALLTGIITPLVTPEIDFDGLLMIKTDKLDLWLMKMQKSNSTISETYIPANLYLNIAETVEEAFKSDHNLIIEEFNFYQRLAPNVQTKLIELIFGEFR